MAAVAPPQSTIECRANIARSKLWGRIVTLLCFTLYEIKEVREWPPCLQEFMVLIFNRFFLIVL